MRTITAIEGQQKRKDRVNLFLDGQFAFGLARATVAEAALGIGRTLTEDQIKELIEKDTFLIALNAAFRYLSYRPRSEAEMKAKLHKRGFSPEITEKVVGRLKELGVLDDESFARFWRESREAVSPRSKGFIRWELRRKGVSGEVVEGVVEDLDDAQLAYQAAQRKTRTLKNLEYQEFRKRLAGFLQRRGFRYDTINSTIGLLWEEGKEA